MLDFYGKKACIFDLDGTLLNTVQDIADAVNTVLYFYGKEVKDLNFFEKVVGTGVEKNLRTMFFEDEDILIDEVMVLFDTEYRKRMFTNTLPYPGVMDALKVMNEKGIVLGVLSNKRDSYVKELVSFYFEDIEFASVQGLRDRLPAKPSAEFTELVLKEMAVDAEDCFYIGDTLTDIKTALNAGMQPVGVQWGYGNSELMEEAGADIILSSVSELIAEYETVA